MTNAELLEKVKPIAESMSQNIASKQHVFNSHKSIIDECKNKGVSNQLITNAINHHLTEGSKLTLHYFKLLLNRSKSQSKKTGVKNENLTDIIREGGIKGAEESHTQPTKTTERQSRQSNKILEHRCSIQENDKPNDLTLQEYLKVCFNSESIAKRAINAGVSIDEIKSWNCSNQIRLGTTLSNHIMNK